MNTPKPAGASVLELMSGTAPQLRPLDEARNEDKSTPPKPAAEPRWAITTGAALLHEDLPPIPWLFQDMLTMDATAAVGGQPKATKTWAILEQAISAASNTNAFGHFTNMIKKPVPVFIWAGEDNKRNIRTRLKAVCTGKGFDAKETEEVLSRIHLFCRGRINLWLPEDVDAFISSIRSLPGDPVRIIFLDTLARVFSLAKEDNAEFSAAAKILDRIRDETKTTVVFIHHMSKDSQDGSNTRRGGQRLRGGSSLHGAVDSGFYMLDPNPKTRSCTLEIENREGEPDCNFTLTMVMEKDKDRQASSVCWKVEAKTEERQEEIKIARAGEEVGKLANQLHRIAQDRVRKKQSVSMSKSEWAALLHGKKEQRLRAVAELQDKMVLVEDPDKPKAKRGQLLLLAPAASNATGLQNTPSGARAGEAQD